jgi:hypothetical protein
VLGLSLTLGLGGTAGVDAGAAGGFEVPEDDTEPAVDDTTAPPRPAAGAVLDSAALDSAVSAVVRTMSPRVDAAVDAAVEEGPAAEVGPGRIAPLCATAHPLHTGFANTLGASISG